MSNWSEKDPSHNNAEPRNLGLKTRISKTSFLQISESWFAMNRTLR